MYQILTIYLIVGFLSLVLLYFFDSKSELFDRFFPSGDRKKSNSFLFYLKWLFLPISVSLLLIVLIVFLPIWALSRLYYYFKKLYKIHQEKKYFKYDTYLQRLFLDNFNSGIDGISKWPKELNRFEFLVFPIFYEQKELEELIRSKEIRKALRNKKAELILFDYLRELTGIRRGSAFVLSRFLKLRYLFPCDDLLINNTILSFLLTGQFDGVNRIVVCSKFDIKKAYIIECRDFDLNKISNQLSQLESCKSNILDTSIFDKVSRYLSLRWERIVVPVSGINNGEFSRLRNETKEFISVVEPDLFETLNLVQSSLFLDLFSEVENVPFWKQIRIKTRNGIPEALAKLGNPAYDKMDKLLTGHRSLKDLENENYIDFRARVFLKTANILFDIIDRDSEIDFSPIVIGYAKFFEREINKSIVQLIRKNLGINMPEFYEKYFEGGGEYVCKDDEDFNVNFNMIDYRTGNYLPPGLGKSILSLKKMLLKFNNVELYEESFIKKSMTINSIRNKSAHPELVGYDDMLKIRNILIEFYDMEVFQKLEEVRSSLVTHS